MPEGPDSPQIRRHPWKIKVVHVGCGTWEARGGGRVMRAQSPEKARWRLHDKLLKKGVAA